MLNIFFSRNHHFAILSGQIIWKFAIMFQNLPSPTYIGILQHVYRMVFLDMQNFVHLDLCTHWPMVILILFDLRYNPFIRDGDSKAYRRVVQEQPYGEAVNVRKEECVSHVQKRMGTNLTKLLDSKKGWLSYRYCIFQYMFEHLCVTQPHRRLPLWHFTKLLHCIKC